MANSTFNVLFYILKNKQLKNGEAPIYARITVNGIRKEFQIKRTVLFELWNQDKECSTGKDKVAKETNVYIGTVRSKLYQIYRELVLADKVITADLVRDLYFGKDEGQKTLLKVFDEYNKSIRELIGKDFVDKTVIRYEGTARYLKEFIKIKYGWVDIPLNHLSISFIRDFDTFLKTKKKCGHNTAITRLKNLKRVIHVALENEWLGKDPFIGYKFHVETVEPEFLTIDELRTIMSKEFSIKRVERVRDVFVFCCFTGLAFSDVQQLKSEHIVTDNKGDSWIRKCRQKTKNMCNIPLLPWALEILDRYKDDPECQVSGTLLPVPTNQRMNAYLKEIADICDIPKDLTTHCARHTFATSISLANGVSLENVSKMLGHSNINMTRHYARVLDQNIFRDMQKIKEQLNGLDI